MCLQIISNCQHHHIKWAEMILGFTLDPERSRSIAVVEGDLMVPRGIAVFDQFTEGDCCIHIASDGSRKWASPAFTFEVFAYPFLILKQRRLTGKVPANNARALRFNEKLGFKREGVIRSGNPECDLILMGMLAQECRFITPEYRKKAKAYQDGKRR